MAFLYLNVTDRLLRAGRVVACFLPVFICMSHLAQAQSEATPLSLNEAARRTLQNNPQLHLFELRARGLQGLKRSDDQSPAYQIQAEVENFAGQGELSGIDSSEQTLALSSVIELGGKRAARVALADARLEWARAEKEAKALELLGELTQAYILALAAQERVELTEDSRTLAEQTLAAVEDRARAGAAPDAEVLRAKAALAQVHIELSKQVRELQAQAVRLASFWGATDADFIQVAGDLFKFPDADSFEELFRRAQNSAAMAVLASEFQLKDAELQLARKEERSDITWSLGVRRLEATGDMGLVAGISLPISTARRSRGGTEFAESEREQADLMRQSALVGLHAQLFEAFQNRRQAIAAAEALKNEVIPALSRALSGTRQAYSQGRYRYMDLLDAQRELLDARQELIDAATEALAHGAVIEQLTAQPLSSWPAGETRAKNLQESRP